MINFLKAMILLLDHSSFKIRKENNYYRTTGFYYCYHFSDTKENRYVVCNWWEATHVAGTSACGRIVPLSDVTGIRYKYRPQFINRITKKRRIKEDRDKYISLKSIPKGLTYEQYRDKILDDVVESIMKLKK